MTTNRATGRECGARPVNLPAHGGAAPPLPLPPAALARAAANLTQAPHILALRAAERSLRASIASNRPKSVSCLRAAERARFFAQLVASHAARVPSASHAAFSFLQGGGGGVGASSPWRWVGCVARRPIAAGRATRTSRGGWRGVGGVGGAVALPRRVERDGHSQVREHEPLHGDAHAGAASLTSAGAVDEDVALIDHVDDRAELALVRTIRDQAHPADLHKALESHRGVCGERVYGSWELARGQRQGADRSGASATFGRRRRRPARRAQARRPGRGAGGAGRRTGARVVRISAEAPQEARAGQRCESSTWRETRGEGRISFSSPLLNPFHLAAFQPRIVPL